MGNRIEACIERYEDRLRKQGPIGLNGVPVESLHESNALTFQDFVDYQNAQTRAHASGRITTEEAATVYASLGGEVYRGDWPEGTSLATKLTITQLVGELLGVKISG
jgi:hypothetical protein